MRDTIPNYTREAISEGCDAAILRAAFRIMEDEEMNEYMRDAEKPCLNDRQKAFAAKLRRRVVRRSARSVITGALPKAMQIAACFIGVIAVGAGIALAASPAAREWAAGVLTTGIEHYEGDNMFDANGPTYYIGDEPAAGYDSAAFADGTLYLLGGVNNMNTIYAQADTEALPVEFAWDDPRNMRLIRISEGEDGLFCLYRDRDDFFDDPEIMYGLGGIRFGEGEFSVEPIAEFAGTRFFPEADSENARTEITDLAWAYGKLYFIAGMHASDDGFFGKAAHRLVCFDPVSGQFSVMKQQEGTWLTDIDLFGGPDGRLFIAAADSEKKISQIGEISPDGGISAIAHIPRQGGEYARAFAVDRDAVYYLLNGAIYEALGFDFENARAVAATSVNGGHGVALGGGSYAVINEEQARIFHFEMADTAIGELVVDFRTSDDRVNARFIETHENIALVKDDAWIRYDGDRRAMIDAGELNADIWILDEDEARMFMEAGIYASIEDESLAGDVARLMPGVREFVTVDGQIAAYPIRGYAYCDFAFSPEILEKLGMDTSDIPETWEEMLDLLDMLSRRPDVDSFCAIDGKYEGGKGFGEKVAAIMAESYARRCAARGETADYESAEYAALLDKLHQIDFSAFRCERRNETFTVDGMEVTRVESPLIFCRQSYETDLKWDALYVGTTLRFNDDSIISRGSGFFAVINPASRKKELALDYIRCHAEVSDSAEVHANLYAHPDFEKLEGKVSPDSFAVYLNRVGDIRLAGSAR